MKWPMSHEFNEAIQNPGLVFSDPDLRLGEAVVGSRGLPLPRSGNFADVYQLSGADGRDWAVKCFTRPVTGLGDRYAAISAALAQAELPFTVGFTFLAEGIRIGGTWWPVVKMEWVEGLLLNQVARENAGRPSILSALGQMWAKLCRKLRESKVAHADLQHGNVLMVPGSRAGAYGLKLIDYDGMYVPALANQPSGENGHSCYQHPSRSGPGGYSFDVDRFPLLLIGTALKSLEYCGRALWDRYDTGDNLLFVEADLKDPGSSKLLRELWLTEQPGIQALVGRLSMAAQRPIPQTPWLDQVAPDGEPLPLDDQARQDAIRALSLSRPLPIPHPPEEPVVLEVEEPSAAARPSALPSGSVFRPFPGARLPVESNDAELVEQPKRKKTKRKIKDQKPAIPSKALLAVGGVLLLVGGIVVGAVLSGGKPRPRTAETKPPEAETLASIPSKPKDPGPKVDAGKIDAGKVDAGKTTKSEPAPPTPKEKIPESVVIPPKPVSNPSNRESLQVSIKELKRIPLGKEHSQAAFDGDGQQLVLAEGPPPSLVSLDVRTGVARRLPDYHRGDGKGNCHLFLLKNRVSVWQRGDNCMTTFDLRMGANPKTIAFPDLPLPPKAGDDAIVAISADTRFVAAGRRSPAQIAGQSRNYTAVPFQLIDTATRKTILSFDWISGFSHFTADSSRVLVVEGTGRGRWYSLPAGKPDVEWQFAEQKPNMFSMSVEAASQDGQRLLCFGTAKGKGLTTFILDGLTGELVAEIGQGYRNYSGQISADGKLAAVLQQTFSPGEKWLVIFDTSSGAELARTKIEEGKGVYPALAFTQDFRKAAMVFRSGNGEAVIYDLNISRGPG